MSYEAASAGRTDAAGGFESLVALEHTAPHSILGAHLEGDAVVVRAFRPDAERVVLLISSTSGPTRS